MSQPTDMPFPWARLLATGFALALFIAGVTARSLVPLTMQSPPTRQRVLDVHAVADGSAIVLWQDKAEDDWISRYSANGEQWRRRLPGQARSISAQDTGIGVGPDYVVIQYVHPTRLSHDLFAVELATGAPRWSVFVESPPLEETRRGRHPIADSMSVFDDEVVVATQTGWTRVAGTTGQVIDLVAIDPLDGEVWRGEVHARGVRTSVGVHRATYGTSCEVRGGKARIDHVVDGDRSSIVVRLEDRVGSVDVVPPADLDWVEGCAEYDGDIVLFSSWRHGTRITVMTRDGRLAHDMQIDGFAGPRWNRTASAYVGALPRFVMMPSHRRAEKEMFSIVDLKTGVVHRRSGDVDELVRDGTTWFRTWRKWRDATAIQLVDGNSAQTVEVIAVPVGTELRRHQIAGGYVWLYVMFADDFSLARIEVATMRVDIQRGALWVAYPRVE